MTKDDRFIAAVMGKCVHEWEHKIGQIYKCKKCGKIDSPNPVTLKFRSDFSASLNGETTYEVRKWFAEHEPEVWEMYLISKSRRGFYDKPLVRSTILNAQLSFDHFAEYMMEHFDDLSAESQNRLKEGGFIK